jgi:rod shape-determining protein MreC
VNTWAKWKPVRDVSVVIFALIVPFAVLRSNLKNPGQGSDFDKKVIQVSAPVQWLAATGARLISNIWGEYVYLVDVKSDNARLVFENARLEDRVRKLEQQEAENRRLRRLLGLRDSVVGDVVSAQVIGKGVTDFFRVWRLSLDRGNREVRAAMPVIAVGGVVGVVQRVAGDTVDVKLLSDPDQAVDVVVERTGARSIIRGSGDLTKYTMKAQYAERVDEIEVGDLMVTSGVGRRFPKGIPVARVVRVVKREFGIYQEVEATPTVDFSRLEEVLILTSPQGDDPNAPAPPKGGR